MATKKSATATRKKSTARKPAPKAATTTTKVTTKSAQKTPRKSTVSTASTSSDRFSFSRSPLLAASIAEFVGTFILAGIVLATQGQPLFVMFGLIIIVLMVGGMSGSHVNPAISVGAWLTKRVSGVRALSYVIAQVLGAMLAFLLMSAYVNAAPAPTAEAAQFGQSAAELFAAATLPAGKEWLVLAAELLGMALFAFAFASAMRMKETISAAFAVGGGLFVGLTIAGTATSVLAASTILNPAIAGTLQAVKWELWPIVIYAVTPLVGSVLGFALNDLLHKESI